MDYTFSQHVVMKGSEAEGAGESQGGQLAGGLFQGGFPDLSAWFEQET